MRMSAVDPAALQQFLNIEGGTPGSARDSSGAVDTAALAKFLSTEGGIAPAPAPAPATTTPLMSRLPVMLIGAAGILFLLTRKK